MALYNIIQFSRSDTIPRVDEEDNMANRVCVLCFWWIILITHCFMASRVK